MNQKMPGGAGWASAWENIPVARPNTRAGRSAWWLWCWVLALCVGQLLLWGVAYGLASRPPEFDGHEQVATPFSLDHGLWTQSALATWVMRMLVSWFGAPVALPLVATQASIVVALALTWRLGCEFMSARRSLVAMLLTSLLTYRIGVEGFGHDVALLPFQSAVLLLFYRASRQGHWGQWLLVGLFSALAMFVHPMALLPLTGLLLYCLLDHRMHEARQVFGMTLAAAAFALGLLALSWWLPPNGSSGWIAARFGQPALPGTRLGDPGVAGLLIVQAQHLLPFLAALWFVLGRRGREHIWSAPTLCAAARDKLFLWIAALSPLALPALLGALTHTEPQTRWGASGLLLSGWLVMLTVRRGDSPAMLRRALQFVICAHVVLYLSLTMSKSMMGDPSLVRIRAEVLGLAW